MKDRCFVKFVNEMTQRKSCHQVFFGKAIFLVVLPDSNIFGPALNAKGSLSEQLFNGKKLINGSICPLHKHLCQNSTVVRTIPIRNPTITYAKLRGIWVYPLLPFASCTRAYGIFFDYYIPLRSHGISLTIFCL